jgi:hypothetical protein
LNISPYNLFNSHLYPFKKVKSYIYIYFNIYWELNMAYKLLVWFLEWLLFLLVLWLQCYIDFESFIPNPALLINPVNSGVIS